VLKYKVYLCYEDRIKVKVSVNKVRNCRKSERRSSIDLGWI